ncbi:MAG: hypothetical protein AAFP19_05550 [Bacteroidota bacterium]
MAKYLSLLFLIFLLLGYSCKTADLRTEELRQDCSDQKALQLLEEMATAHQLDRWENIQTYQIHLTDEFYGLFGKMGNPYPKNRADIELTYIPGTFTGQGVFKSGKWKDKLWGIQSWRTYEKGEDDKIQFHKKNKKDIEFWLPTYQYFIELPMRIREADVFCYAGERKYKDQVYDVVFASWKTASPQKDLDQYLLWINRETKLLDAVEYTIRDVNKWIKGVLFYEDYREIEGLLIAHQMPVRSFSMDAKKVLHEIKVLEVAVNTLDRNSLLPNPNLGDPAQKGQ